MRELLRRFRYPLTYLLLACLCVIRLAASPTPQELSLPSRMLLGVTVEIEEAVTLPLSFVERAWNGYIALVGVAAQNRRLQERVARLERENLEYMEALVASERFRRVKEFEESRSLATLPATVIANDLSPWFRTVVIDKGTLEGVRNGMPVVADGGVAGVVAGTTAGASRVLLVTDPQSRIDVYVQRTRSRGTLRGRSAETCAFEYVLRDADLQVGDVLLTSGLDTLYPKGVRIGRVSAVRRQPFGLFLEADVETAVDFRRLEEVFVVLNQEEVPPPEAFDTDGGGLFSDASAPPTP